jgi:hypothetical protein
MRSCNFVGACAFWRALDRLAHPEPLTRFHAIGVLQEFARKAFDKCHGVAYSPQEAECFEFCGLTPLGILSTGSLGRASAETE